MARPVPADDPVTPWHLLTEGSPAQLREAIVAEDVPEFDRQFEAALDAVRGTLSLAAVDEFLTHWRPRAAHQVRMGHDRWREIAALGEYVEQHGHPPPRYQAGRPWREVMADLGL